MQENEWGPGQDQAVCAHIGVGADDEQARAARDRLADVLAMYRRALQRE